MQKSSDPTAAEISEILREHRLPETYPGGPHDNIAAATAKLLDVVRRMENYGRLHEIIEAFQAGAVSAEYYSRRHEAITAQITPPDTDGGRLESQDGEG